MHVLITTDAIGGVWTYTQELACGLLRRGIKVTLVSFGEIPSPDQTEWMDGFSNLDFRATGFPLEWMQEGRGDVEASQEYLKAVIAEVGPDLLHFNQYCYGAIAPDLPRIVVAHSDVISWWRAVHNADPPTTQWLRWYREQIQTSIAAADAVIAPSRWMLDSLRNIYGEPNNGLVINNGRTPARFNPDLPKESLALSVGRIWDSGKQTTLLCRQDLPLDVVIAGCGDHPDPAVRNTVTVSPIPRVRLLGKQNESQLRQLLGKASIYAATSRYEPFGLAPLEAALSRSALLMNDIPVFRELWGDAALYFEHNCGDSLRAGLAQLQQDSALRNSFANRAYERARRLFCSDRMVSEYLELYRVLAAQHLAAA